MRKLYSFFLLLLCFLLFGCGTERTTSESESISNPSKSSYTSSGEYEGREYTSLSSIKYIDSDTAYRYFVSNGTLINDVEFNEVYYEISEYDSFGIKRIIRFYHDSSSLYLIRGYTTNNELGAGIITQDTFTIGIMFDLDVGSFTCKGLYSRMGIAAGTATGGGTVEITYNIPSISIDDKSSPLVPDFSAIKYSYRILDASSQSRMQQLWNSDGRSYAESCYAQINTMLATLAKYINVYAWIGHK